MVNLSSVILAAVFLAGGMIIFRSFLQVPKLYKAAQYIETANRRKIMTRLKIHRLLMGVFSFGYIGMACLSFYPGYEIERYLVPVVFLLGAIFVSVGVSCQAAMGEEITKTLQGLLPICSNCKRIRKEEEDLKDQAQWTTVDRYIVQHTSADLTHGLCPDCLKKLYPEDSQ